MPRTSPLVVVSNRLPVRRIRGAGGQQVWETSPGGLVTALGPVLGRQPSTWIGWIGAPGRPPEPFEHGGVLNIPVPCSRAELRAFYEGFSNRTLWPLYHDVVRMPDFQRSWWRPYVDVNRRFAEHAAAAAAPGAFVWVHDYHLQLVPIMLRELRPDVRIGFFLHIPFPPSELFARLPWRMQIIEGLLGADVVGFQTRSGSRNFMDVAARYGGAERVSRNVLRHEGRDVHVDAFPISIDGAAFAELARSPKVREIAQRLRGRLHGPRRVLLGVDRLDYTKGIDIRLHAYRDLLRSRRITPGDSVLVQVAVPSRERVAEYRELRAEVERLVGEINGEFGELGRHPVHYLHRSVPRDELVALYLLADVMLVTPVRDGMNLVAKEYAACRTEGRGVLVLSEFTGAAGELSAALLVNPYDIDGLADTVFMAAHMPEGEQKRRMRSLRTTIRRNDVFRWADRFMGAALR